MTDGKRRLKEMREKSEQTRREESTLRGGEGRVSQNERDQRPH